LDIFLIHLASWVFIVCKSDVWTNKYIAFYSDPIPNLNTSLYGYIIANFNIIFNEDMGAYVAILANDGTFQDYAKLPYLCIFTNHGGLAISK